MLALKAEGKTVGATSAVDVFAVPSLAMPPSWSWSRWSRRCVPGACARTWPTATADSRAPCAPPTGRGASVALVAGDRDIEAGTVGVKDLSTGEQVDVAADAVVAEVLSRLA